MLEVILLLKIINVQDLWGGKEGLYVYFPKAVLTA